MVVLLFSVIPWIAANFSNLTPAVTAEVALTVLALQLIDRLIFRI